jgi:hypothetical protein
VRFPPSTIDSLLDQSSGLTRSAHLPGAVPAGFASEADVAEILREVARSDRADRDLHVYLDGERDPHAARAARALEARSCQIEAWAKQAFAGRAVGILLYRCERYHGELAGRVALFLDELYRRVGVEPGGAEIMVFAGDYGYSPFGAHKDRHQGCTFHFHLGPSDKSITIWDDETYARVAGTTERTLDPAPIVPAGQTTTIGAGDIFVLPAGGYHVGYTPRFSLGVAVSLIELTVPRLLARLGRRVDTERLGPARPVTIPRQPLGGDGRTMRATVEEALERPLADARLRAALDEAVEDSWDGQSSNHGMRYAPPLMDAQAPLPARLRRRPPFELRLRVDGSGHAVLYGRARRAEFRGHPELAYVVAELNADQEVSVAELASRLAPRWTPAATESFLCMLYRFGVLQGAPNPPEA